MPAPARRTSPSRRTLYLRTRFSDVDEFVQELTVDVELVERRIVRITQTAQATGPSGVLVRITVQAGAIVEGRPVILESRIGELWGESSRDDEVLARATAMTDDLTGRLGALGLEVRPGLLEENTDA